LVDDDDDFRIDFDFGLDNAALAFSLGDVNSVGADDDDDFAVDGRAPPPPLPPSLLLPRANHAMTTI